MGQVRLWHSPRKTHYRDHLLPIWEALPDDIKVGDRAWRADDILLIAGSTDIKHGFKYILVEHGAGQTYVDYDGPGYSGGHGYNDCLLFICPNQEVADRWSVRYPRTPTAVVGSPRLDPWHRGYKPPERTVAITFHWECSIVPETRSAWSHYEKDMHLIVDSYRLQGWKVLGHEHPRWHGSLRKRWEELGVEWTDDPLRDASVLVADNTSLMAEFLSCERPVVALNAPWYRRDVEHGQRFWDWDVTYADSPLEASMIDLDLLFVPTDHPYAFADGQAAQRSSSAILDLIR